MSIRRVWLQEVVLLATKDVVKLSDYKGKDVVKLGYYKGILKQRDRQTGGTSESAEKLPVVVGKGRKHSRSSVFALGP